MRARRGTGPFLLLAVSVTLWTAAHAAVDEASFEDVEALAGLTLDELYDLPVVTAAKRTQATAEAPSILTTFRRDDLERLGVTSLADVLEYAPGIDVSMGPAGDYRIAIRGVRRDGTVLLLLDGLPLNGFYDGHAIFDLPVGFIERVEVVRGPGSALYGTNAVVGVVNVITRKEARSVRIAGGSHASYGAGLDIGTTAAVPSHLSLGFARTDGPNARLGGTEPAYRGRTGRFLEEVYLLAGTSPGPLRLSAFALSRTRGAWTGPLFELTSGNELRKTIFVSDVRLETELDSGLRLAPRLYGTLVLHDYLYEDHATGFAGGGIVFPHPAFTRERYDALSVGTELLATWAPSDPLAVLAGAVYERHRLLEYDLARNYQVIGLLPRGTFGNHDGVELRQDGRSRDVTALFGQAEARLGDLALTLGLRYDRYSDTGDAWNPRLGLVYRVRPDFSVKGLYAHAFRAPTFRELFDETRVGNNGVRSNPDLAAETIRTGEIGLEVKLAPFLVRANAFASRSDDLIATFDPEGTGARATTENVGRTETVGGEVEAILLAGRRLEVFLNMSGFRMEFDWADGEKFRVVREYLARRGHRRIVNIPNFRLNAGATLRLGRFDAFVGLNNGGRSGANDRSPIEGIRAFAEPVVIEDYLQIDASVHVRLDPIRIRLAVNNIDVLGARHADPDESTGINIYGHRGLRQPEETVVIGMSYAF